MLYSMERKRNGYQNGGMLTDYKWGIISVTAFLGMSSAYGLKKIINEIAWKTEIWVAEQPHIAMFTCFVFIIQCSSTPTFS